MSAAETSPRPPSALSASSSQLDEAGFPLAEASTAASALGAGLDSLHISAHQRETSPEPTEQEGNVDSTPHQQPPPSAEQASSGSDTTATSAGPISSSSSGTPGTSSTTVPGGAIAGVPSGALAAPPPTSMRLVPGSNVPEGAGRPPATTMAGTSGASPAMRAPQGPVAGGGVRPPVGRGMAGPMGMRPPMGMGGRGQAPLQTRLPPSLQAKMDKVSCRTV